VILTRIFPIPDGATTPISLESPDARERILELYRPPRADWVRLNLIGTLSGSAVGPDGTSDTITNPVDRIILRTIRSLADVVVVGAQSVRAEAYFAPQHAALAVVSRSGDLSGRAAPSSSDHGQLIVLCPEDAVARARETVADPSAEVISVADVGGSLSATAIVDTLRAAGCNSIVAEGGPTLAAHLLRGGVIDELCLTTSPQLDGARLPLFGADEFAAVPLALTQLLIDDASATYARWAAQRIPN
jgi:riboflavin biosynthesis pyrimidine reductase